MNKVNRIWVVGNGAMLNYKVYNKKLLELSTGQSFILMYPNRYRMSRLPCWPCCWMGRSNSIVEWDKCKIITNLNQKNKMKKLIYTLLLLLVTFPAMAQSLFEQYERFLTEPRTYVCYRPDGKLKIDGKLNESSWKKAAPTAPFVDISGEGFPTPKYETTAKMLWDDEYLYVGAVLQEEDIKARLTQRDTIIYYDNDFEVFIDPDSDGHNYFEIETNARGVIFDLMLDKPYRSGGNFMVQWDCPRIEDRHPL